VAWRHGGAHVGGGWHMAWHHRRIKGKYEEMLISILMALGVASYQSIMAAA